MKILIDDSTIEMEDMSVEDATYAYTALTATFASLFDGSPPLDLVRVLSGPSNVLTDGELAKVVAEQFGTVSAVNMIKVIPLISALLLGPEGIGVMSKEECEKVKERAARKAAEKTIWLENEMEDMNLDSDTEDEEEEPSSVVESILYDAVSIKEPAGKGGLSRSMKRK